MKELIYKQFKSGELVTFIKDTVVSRDGEGHSAHLSVLGPVDIGFVIDTKEFTVQNKHNLLHCFVKDNLYWTNSRFVVKLENPNKQNKK